jgi:hypothetical protein
MPRLSDIISEKSKKNIMKIKSAGATVPINFAGQTPNLNSSLGVNAFAGIQENFGPDSFGGIEENFGRAKEKFVGTTENFDAGALTSSVMAGASSASTQSEPSQSKLDSFWTKNQNILTGIGSYILGGPTTNTSPSGSQYPVEEKKKGVPAWAWILIAVVTIVIIVFIVKAAKK